jgi:hypothetical protein
MKTKKTKELNLKNILSKAKGMNVYTVIISKDLHDSKKMAELMFGCIGDFVQREYNGDYDAYDKDIKEGRNKDRIKFLMPHYIETAPDFWEVREGTWAVENGEIVPSKF